MFCPRQLYGITGYPLGHSLSPRLHNWGFAQQELSAVFLAWPVPPQEVEDFVRAVRVLDIRGACVTIPHKESVLPLLDRVSDRARRVGAVNTLHWDGEMLCGENTDVDGFMAPLQAAGATFTPQRVLVLGAGGAARAVLAGLYEMYGQGDSMPRVAVSNRHADKAQTLAQDFGVGIVDWDARHHWQADMVVNTTPLGMRGAAEAQTPFEAQGFQGQGLAYDLVYNPLETRFLREAQGAGWAVQDGLSMFVAQGLAQFRLWTGRELSVEAARTLLLAAL